jgi:hypothetical protein
MKRDPGQVSLRRIAAAPLVFVPAPAGARLVPFNLDRTRDPGAIAGGGARVRRERGERLSVDRVAPRRHRARQWLPQRFVELLDRDTPAKPQELEKARSMMLDVVASLGITRAQRGSSCRPTR